MREGWKTMKLDDACFVDYGTRVVRKKDGGTIYPVYGGGGATFQMDIYNRENCLVVARFAMSQTCTRFVQGKFFLNDSGLTLRAKDKDLSQQLLDWIIISKNDLIYSFGKGSAQKNLDMEDFRNMEISFPVSLPEQQRIVDILDREFAKIDALKANAEKSLQAAKDLFQATLKKELEPKEGWKKYCLKDVCTDYGDYGMSLPSKAYESVRYLRITDITEWGELNNDRVSVDTDVIDDRYMLKEGDVLFARTGATVGKTLVYEDAFGDCCYAGYLIRYRPNQDIVLPRMLYFITHSASYYEWVATNQKSATLPNISAKLYNTFALSLPSIKEQKEIVSRLDDLANKSKALNGNYQKTLTLCDDLKQTILRKAFNGEL